MEWFLLFAFAAGLLYFLLKLVAPAPQPAHKLAGIRGEHRVRQRLQAIGPPVAAVLWSGDMRHAGRRFEIDALALVEGVGIVVAEVKNYSGTLHCDAGPRWLQRNQRGERAHRNASQQVLRTADCVRTLLQQSPEWRHRSVPIVPVVIFARDDLQLEAGQGRDAPQTDLVQISRLESWLRGLHTRQRAAGFSPTEADTQALLSCLRRHERRAA